MVQPEAGTAPSSHELELPGGFFTQLLPGSLRTLMAAGLCNLCPGCCAVKELFPDAVPKLFP